MQLSKAEEQKRLVIEHYLQCHTQEQIANILGLTQGRVAQIIKNVRSDIEAIKRNAIHGRQLTRAEKRSLTVHLYEQGQTQEDLASLLAVDQSTVSKWLKNIREAKAEEQKRLMMEYYLQCYTHEEIANILGLSRGRITQIVKNMKFHIEANPPKPGNVWLYTYRLMPTLDTSTLTYPGNLPPEIVENVLYYWTKPFDVVVDPMAGGGVVIDACRKMFRRYRAYDIRPVRGEIKKWDFNPRLSKRSQKLRFNLP